LESIKVNAFDVGGEVVKDNETYLLKDNKTLNNLVLSSTKLYRDQSTRGHRHAGQEEVYFFVQGSGKMIVGEEDSEPFRVSPGMIVLIPDGAFHRVINDGEMHLIFNCVFDGKRNH
jgi:oxalate decarboxylase/phosphoglucose isomerase-like protein (cupin superfamily)